MHRCNASCPLVVDGDGPNAAVVSVPGRRARGYPYAIAQSYAHRHRLSNAGPDCAGGPGPDPYRQPNSSTDPSYYSIPFDHAAIDSHSYADTYPYIGAYPGS